MNFALLKTVVALLVVTTTANAAAQFNVVRRQLSRHYQLGKIRVFYNTAGVHAVQPQDLNRNQVPDQVEDIARQTNAAYQLFVDALNFPDPLKSQRYLAASYIDVNILAKSTIKLNGIAYDGLQAFGRSIDPVGTRSISFDVANSVDATKSITAAHEMFHLIQNGATYFKTRWYTEGMARWSEHALDHGGVGQVRYQGPWPQTEAQQNWLFKQTYDAEFWFWNPLADQSDPAGDSFAQTVKPEIRNLTFVNGAPILRDLELKGWGFMRDVLTALAKQDDVAFQQLGYRNWSEDNQKSLRNSRFIYESVMTVAKQYGLRE